MASVEELNKKLTDFPYVSGYSPSQEDVKALASLPAKYDQFVHVKRWAKHMTSFSDAEKKAFPGAPAAAAAPASKGGDDDDDFDLFGDDDEDSEAVEKAKKERADKMAAEKKGAKPAVVAKSTVVLDVKVWDDETDLKEVENQVRAIQKDGLLWGAAALKPLAFGINKLQIVCVVEDEKISIDQLTEQIEELELVQSTDIAAFQKI